MPTLSGALTSQRQMGVGFSKSPNHITFKTKGLFSSPVLAASKSGGSLTLKKCSRYILFYFYLFICLQYLLKAIKSDSSCDTEMSYSPTSGAHQLACSL